MPASKSSPQISKVTARRAIERLPEVRNGQVKMELSVAGYCNDSSSDSYGKVWALLSTESGPVQYTGLVDEMRRSRAPSGDFAAKAGDLIVQKMSEGFQDIDSGTLNMRPWSSTDVSETATYRGKKCATKKRGPCVRSKKCTYRKGVFSSGGKKMRKASCAKKSRKSRKSRRSRSGKKMRAMRKRSSSSKSRSKSPKRRRRSSKKMRKISKANMLGKDACKAAPGATWVSGKKGSRVGYCRKVKRSRKSLSGKRMRRISRSSSKSPKKSAKRRRSGKKMRRVSKCNTLKSGKKRSRKSCKASSKCSWKKGSKGRKGHCARKSKK
jgi:hypothetical protein